jgi:hypothetical protein
MSVNDATATWSTTAGVLFGIGSSRNRLMLSIRGNVFIVYQADRHIENRTSEIALHGSALFQNGTGRRQNGRTSGHEKRGLSFRRAITLFETSEP